MNLLFAIIFYLLGIFATLCGILLNIYFRPSEKKKYGYVYPDVSIMLMIWPITILMTIIILFFKYIIIDGIFNGFGEVDHLIDYVAKKGGSRQLKKRISKIINESEYYESKNNNVVNGCDDLLDSK